MKGKLYASLPVRVLILSTREKKKLILKSFSRRELNDFNLSCIFTFTLFWREMYLPAFIKLKMQNV